MSEAGQSVQSIRSICESGEILRSGTDNHLDELWLVIGEDGGSDLTAVNVVTGVYHANARHTRMDIELPASASTATRPAENAIPGRASGRTAQVGTHARASLSAVRVRTPSAVREGPEEPSACALGLWWEG